MAGNFELVIKPRSGWETVDFREVALYRELLGFLVWRDIKIRYRQTVLGAAWAILQPLAGMVIFTVVFNRMAGLRSDGPPYPLFAFAGLIPWTFFSNGVSTASNSLITNQQLVSKIYFPRIFIPIGSIGALLIDLGLSLTIFFLMLLRYHWPLTLKIFWLPFFTLAAFLAAAGLGLVLSALNVSFRDVKYAVPFLIQMGIFVTPVIYPLRYIPAAWQNLLALNPMAGIVLGFRAALLGSPIPVRVTEISLTMSLFLFVAGLMIFRRLERRFADLI
ncbi:MAG TPA: ABC transporter permease [Terriglobales bacterium]|nr:ABC transporter permease [Terriglobales bacterium]